MNDTTGGRKNVALFAVVVAVVGLSGVPALTGSPSRERVSAHSDFNGDGYSDLAIGVPGESVGAVSAGGVNVLYGSAAGLTAVGDQFWTQDTAEVEGVAEDDDNFGAALAAGDFDGDGFADLGIGGDVGPALYAGGVNVLYGSAAGLTAVDDQFWTQDSPGVEEVAGDGDGFGQALAAADFDGDGFADLAIGVPFETLGTDYGAGGVNVLYGSAAGLTAAGDQFWSQNSVDVNGQAEQMDSFGSTLAAANFGNSAEADLAVGVPYEGISGASDAGGVNVLYGSAAGLTAAGDQFWSQKSPDVIGKAEFGDSFGLALAAANFGNSAEADLAVGVPYEGISGASDAGGVNVLYGSAAGLTAVGDQFWTQDSADVNEGAEAADFFGSALAAANFGNGAEADLAIGVTHEDLGTAGNTGGLNVLYGSAAGLSAVGDQFWSQNKPGVEDEAEQGDAFGWSLTAADFGDSAHADLSVGVPYEIFETFDEGGVNILYGSGVGLTATNDQFWSQDSPEIEDVAEASDWFGYELVV